ncbi:MAG TPA: hypothetical protein VND64_00695, partial [Pirellulales bacterium]|nr:hypothetical protein [Pirellulales bacterium]
MPKYGFLVVEGPHDVEFTYRLLSPFGFQRIQFEADLDNFLKPLIPRSYPPDGDLQKRMNTPLFLRNLTHIVAVRSAIGDSRLVDTVEENMSKCDAAAFAGIGLLLDSDKLVPAAERYATVKAGLAAKGFALPDQPGAIA